jgi:hypothetical protein
VLDINVRDVEHVHDQLGMSYKKVQNNFLGKHYGVKLNCRGRGDSTHNRHLAVVLDEEFGFPHYITIHKLVCFHGEVNLGGLL